MNDAIANAAQRYERKYDWGSLMKAGFIVKLEVSFFRGRRKLSAAELGLDERRITPDVQDVLRLGTKRVAPLWYAKQARSIESTARTLLSRYSLQSPFGHFVPDKAWEVLAPKLAKYEVRFHELTQRLYDRWDEERQLVLRQFEAAFRDLRLSEEQKQVALAAVEDSWPSLEDVKAATRWDVFAYRVDIPEAPADPQTEAEKVQLAYVARLEATFTEAVESFGSQVRRALAAWAEKVADSVGKRDSVPATTISAIRRNIERFRSLDIVGDEEVGTLLASMEELIEAGPAKLKLTDEEYASGIERAAKRIAKAAQRDLDPTKLRFGAILQDDEKEKAVSIKAESADIIRDVAARFRAASAT